MDEVPKERIGRMFSALAPRYRSFNRWSSLGLDGRWRQTLVGELAGARRVLDLGTGTGDLAWRVWSLPGRPVVVGFDLSLDMLAQARRHGGGSGPGWVHASADGMPFRSGAFDAVVSAFVLRNLIMGGVLPVALKESSRVLEAGGRLVFLDLTRPRNVLLRWGHGLYNRTAMPLLGRWICGKAWPGSYLNRSIQALPEPLVLARLFTDNGYSSFECRPLWGGIVSLFIGKK